MFALMSKKLSKQARILSHTGNKIVVEIEVEKEASFLQCEEAIQDTVNAIGREMTHQGLQLYGTDADIITIGDIKAYDKGVSTESYQSPFGPVLLPRHVYQTSLGGRTYCPLEVSAGIMGKTTPKFAKQVSSKFSNMSAKDVVFDLDRNHSRKVSQSFVQDIVNTVGTEIECSEEEHQWQVLAPESPAEIATISAGLDGAMLNTRKDGWREGMVGTIAFFDKNGNRIETHYVAAAPEYGKETFESRFLRSLEQAKKIAPDATVIGLADGAKWNWGVLNKVTDIQLLDFYHVTEYLASFAEAIFPHKQTHRHQWLDNACHNLKHKQGAAKRLLDEMKGHLKKMRNKTKRKEIVEKCTRYFASGLQRMKYHKNTKAHMPIGSGVTEAACKVIIKQRLCHSGARWSNEKAGKVMLMRCMNHSGNRWNKFWEERSENVHH